jgi:hypothetical protein
VDPSVSLRLAGRSEFVEGIGSVVCLVLGRGIQRVSRVCIEVDMIQVYVEDSGMPKGLDESCCTVAGVEFVVVAVDAVVREIDL